MSEVFLEKVAGEEPVQTPVETPEPSPESLVEGVDPVKAEEDAPAKTETIREKAEKAAAALENPQKGSKEAASPSATPGTPEWAPNFKLKVLNEEKEIEEWARPLINKDNEKQVRELFEKAYAADHLKTRRDEATAKVQEYEGKLENYVQTVQKIRGYADKDFGRFLKETNIPPQKVMSWVRQQLERHEFLQRDDIPAEVKQGYIDQEEQRQRALDLEEQNQALQGSHVDVAVHAKTAELNRSLNQDGVRDFATAFDQRLEKPGAFREFVVQHAANVWQSSKGTRDLTGEEAVSETLRLLGYTSSQGGNAGAASPKPNATPNAPNVITAPPKKTVIPNVGSGSAVAMTKKPKSLDDLRKMAKEARS